jgi:hypothetical protein
MGNLPAVELWFDKVEIKPNEVVYLGTFNLSAITVNAQAGVLQNVFSLGLTALTALTGNYNYYPTYAMVDQSEKVRAQVREKYPQYADRMVTRLPEAILVPEDFAGACRNAYARKPDGSMPTPEEAEAKLDGEMDKAVAASIARYSAAHPEFKKDTAPAPAPKPATPP